MVRREDRHLVAQVKLPHPYTRGDRKAGYRYYTIFPRNRAPSYKSHSVVKTLPTGYPLQA